MTDPHKRKSKPRTKDEWDKCARNNRGKRTVRQIKRFMEEYNKGE